jgi:signal transduction histidine kinase
MRRRFVRRAALLGVAVVLVFTILAAAVAWLLGGVFHAWWIWPLLWIGFIVLVGRTVLGVLRGIRRGAEPLGDLIEASARVEAGQYGVRVTERGPGEIQALIRAFNGMSARLAARDEQRRRLLADVSHELRTPLTVIQGNVEGMLDGLYPADRDHLERVLAETRQLERLIEDLRTLSLAEAGSLPLHREPTDLVALAAEVVAGFGPQAEGAGVGLAIGSSSVVRDVSIDPQRIRQVVTNLVSNALRHTPAGGRVTIEVARDGERATLSVTDTGEGMDAEAAGRAFDRFWRSPDSGGAGLGLAIVRDLVEAHGGTVELDTAPGRGTTVRCVLPAG